MHMLLAKACKNSTQLRLWQLCLHMVVRTIVLEVSVSPAAAVQAELVG